MRYLVICGVGMERMYDGGSEGGEGESVWMLYGVILGGGGGGGWNEGDGFII